MGHTHTAIAGHVRAAHALRRIAAAHHRKASRELVLAARASARRNKHAAAAHRWAQRSSHVATRTRTPSLGATLVARTTSTRTPSLGAALVARTIALAARERLMLGAALVARELTLAAREAPHACARQCALWRSSLAAHTRLLVPCSRPRPFAHCTQPTTQGRAAALCSCTMPLLAAFVPHGRRAPLLVVACPHYTTPLKGNT